jgi:hypothetical protein
MAVGVLGGLAYIVGGCDGDQHCNVNAGFCSCPTITNSLTIYNPVLDQYKRGRSAPRPRYRHNVCTWNDDKLFVFGGRDTADAIIREVDVYTASTNLWTTLADPLPADLGSDNSCSMMLDAIYLAGGYASDYSVAFNSTYRFSPTAGTWTRLSGQMAVARGDFSSVAFQDRMHVYGGYTTADFCAPVRGPRTRGRGLPVGLSCASRRLTPIDPASSRASPPCLHQLRPPPLPHCRSRTMKSSTPWRTPGA